MEPYLIIAEKGRELFSRSLRNNGANHSTATQHSAEAPPRTTGGRVRGVTEAHGRGACQPPYPARLVEDQQLDLGDVLYLQRFYGAHGHHEPKRACTAVQHLAASVAATAHRSCSRSATQQHLFGQFGPQPASPPYVGLGIRFFGSVRFGSSVLVEIRFFKN